MCMIEGLDERAKVWNETTQRAQKKHLCCECGRAITVGERYVKLWAIGSDGPFRGKWCAHCDVAKEWLWKECGGSILTQVLNDIVEHLDEYRGQRLRRLKILEIGMRRKWRIVYGARGGLLMPIPAMPQSFEVRA